MRRNGSVNKEKESAGSKSGSSSPSSSSSSAKPTSPRLTLRFQTIRDKSAAVNSSASSLANNTGKAYCVSSNMDKPSNDKADKDKDGAGQTANDKNGDNTTTANNGQSDSSLTNADHNYTSVDSSAEEALRGRKRRKSNDGNVSSTSASAAPSRSSSTSSVSSHQSSHNSKKHHHHHHHHHHHKGNGNSSSSNKEKSSKKTYCSSSSDSEEDNFQNNPEAGGKEPSVSNASNPASGDLKVPPLRIVIPTVISSSSAAPVNVTTSNSNGFNNPSTTSSVTSATSSSGTKFPYVVTSSSSAEDALPSTEPDGGAPGSGSSQRITRSSQRVAQQQSQKQVSADNHQSDSEESSHPTNPGDSQHPRKRKLRKEGDIDNDSCSSSSSQSALNKEVSPFAMPASNCYQMYLNIRKQVDKKRKEMFLVQPKSLPTGFKDYLLNRCSYVLEGKSDSRNSKPTLASPPASLAQGSAMHNLFCDQEKQRYKLKLQHLIEREKLVLSAEQEILRVHGRAARAMANQNVPFSVCSILKDEEIYNTYDNENELSESRQENAIKMDKSSAAGLSGRTRYNGRLFLSWLQDVDDKWEKIKAAMLLRHRKESESLLAMQKLEWEWKLKESGLCDVKLTPSVNEVFVPAVAVNSDFDLLPA